MANYYIESEFTYKNFRCVVVFNALNGCRCGYVEIPWYHPIADKDYPFVEVCYNSYDNIRKFNTKYIF